MNAEQIANAKKNADSLNSEVGGERNEAELAVSNLEASVSMLLSRLAPVLTDRATEGDSDKDGRLNVCEVAHGFRAIGDRAALLRKQIDATIHRLAV